MLAPESEVLPGQVSSRLFGGLKAGEVRCVTCICTCMQRAQLLLLPLSAQKPQCPSIHPFLLPNSSQRQHASGAFCQSPGRNNVVWVGVCVCVEAEVISAAPARDWSCSQSCAQMAINALGGMWFNVLTVCQRSSPWSVKLGGHF